MVRQLLLKESSKAQEELSLAELQAMQVQASARLRVLEERGGSAGLGAEYLNRVRGHVERVARRVEAKKEAEIRRKKEALLGLVVGG